MQDLKVLIKPLLELSHRAGEVICSHYDSAQSGEYEAKGDESPLTQADVDSHGLLVAGLAGLDGGKPILSEETTGVSAAERMSWTRYWLVDPLDGTKEFLARTGEFTVNIALIDDHKPVLGLLYLPLEQRGYLGIPGLMARCYQRRGAGQWDSRAVSTRPLESGTVLTVVASRRHRGARLERCLDWLGRQWGAIERDNSGSALKFCQLAEGQGDFYPRFSRCCEWDTAAGQALLEAAGGGLLGMDGQPLRYNCSESLYSPDFYGLGDVDHPLWRKTLDVGF